MYLHYGCMHTDALLTVLTFTDPASCCMHGKEKGITANTFICNALSCAASYFLCVHWVLRNLSYTHAHNNSSCVSLEVVGMCGLRKACA